MTPVKLRKEHLLDLAELEKKLFSDPWSIDALAFILCDRATGYCVEEDGHAVAYGGLLYAPDEGQILNLGVDEHYRRRGYGKAILSALEADARDRGAKALYLEVRASNLPAIGLYQACGFFALGRRPNFYRTPIEDAILMKKELD